MIKKDYIQNTFAIITFLIVLALLIAGIVFATANYYKWKGYRDDPSKVKFVEQINAVKSIPRGERTVNDYINLGNAYHSLEEYNLAIGAYKRAAFDFGFARVGYSNLANDYALIGDYRKAETVYLKSLDQDPSQPQLYVKLAELYEKQWKNKVYDSISILQKGLEVIPGHPDMLIKLALYYKDSGDKEQAIEYYEQAIKSNPENEEAKKELDELKYN